jgi:flagellar FliJ protein
MAKFRFAFESLLTYRRRLEDVARRDYIEAKANLDAVLNEINSMYKSIDRSKELIGQLESKPPISIEEIRQAHSFVSGQLKKIDVARLRSRELMTIAEDKHYIMVEAAKQSKILDKLKEKKRLHHRSEQNKKETKIADDMITMRFRGGMAK